MIEEIWKNNVTIALKVLYAKKEKRYPAYVSKHNSNCEKELILIIISNREGREVGRTAMALSCSKKIISIIKRNYIKK